MKELILEQFKEGRLVIATPDGLGSVRIEDFIQQPADGMLYDLNRGEETTLTLADNNHIRFVNDFAVAKVIRALKTRIEEVETKYLELKEAYDSI